MSGKEWDRTVLSCAEVYRAALDLTKCFDGDIEEEIKSWFRRTALSNERMSVSQSFCCTPHLLN